MTSCEVGRMTHYLSVGVSRQREVGLNHDQNQNEPEDKRDHQVLVDRDAAAL